jgi:hypothetical protein
METVRVEGRSGVVSLLRKIADGLDGGAISLGGAEINCSDHLVAIVTAPDVTDGVPGPEHPLVLNLRFEWARVESHPLAVEEELPHPGA